MGNLIGGLETVALVVRSDLEYGFENVVDTAPVGAAVNRALDAAVDRVFQTAAVAVRGSALPGPVAAAAAFASTLRTDEKCCCCGAQRAA